MTASHKYCEQCGDKRKFFDRFFDPDENLCERCENLSKKGKVTAKRRFSEENSPYLKRKGWCQHYTFNKINNLVGKFHKK